MLEMGSRGRRKQRWCTTNSTTTHHHHHHHHQPLTPLMEGPDLEMQHERSKKESSWEVIREWFKVQRSVSSDNYPAATTMSSSNSSNSSNRQGGVRDLRLLLGVLACPLAPIPLPLKLNININEYNSSGGILVSKDHHLLDPPVIINNHIPIETCTAHYIIQQYLAATGCSSKKQKMAKNMYTAGTVNMICCQTEVSSTSGDRVRVKTMGTRQQSSSSGGGGGGEKGCFVLWQMSPGMWSLELVVGGNKVVAGSDSKIVWRHTPWLGTHAAKGPQRPLRRIIQGLDPKSTASLFAGKEAKCLGEKRIGEEDCFVLKVAADRAAVMERNEGPAAEVIRHVLYGYFSQRSGLLIYLEDSHLTRVLVNQAQQHQYSRANDLQTHHQYQCDAAGAAAVYWETTIGSSIGDYRDVDGVLVAHQGRTVATVFRFGDTSSSQQYCRTTMEEIWTIHDVVFDVPGLSVDCFIPPADILLTQQPN